MIGEPLWLQIFTTGLVVVALAAFVVGFWWATNSDDPDETNGGRSLPRSQNGSTGND